MSDSSAFVRPHLSHLGIFVRDIGAMTAFYTEVFGLLVTDTGVGKVFRNNLVFLSGAADQHHQLVLSSGREEGAASTIMQLSFRVNALDDLRNIQDLALTRGASELIGLNHGNAWSVYFYDPEGNRVEVYIDTPFHTPQPCGEPLDLTMDDAAIFSETERLVAGLPGSMPRTEYVAELGKRLG